MHLLEQEKDIVSILQEWLYLSNEKPLLFFCDTEVANWQLVASQRTLSLFQLFGPFENNSSEQQHNNAEVYLLDLFSHLQQQNSISQILLSLLEQFMQNGNITKVFHNASFDVTYLMNLHSTVQDQDKQEEIEDKKCQVKSVVCTLEMAKQIPYFLLPLSSFKLSSLYHYFTSQQQEKEDDGLSEQLEHQLQISKEQKDTLQQQLYWNRRPLTKEEIEYASNDVLMLKQVYYHLLSIQQLMEPCKSKEELFYIEKQVLQIEKELKILASKEEFLLNKLKQEMGQLGLEELNHFELKWEEKKLRPSIGFHELEKLSQQHKVKLTQTKVQITKAIKEAFYKKGVNILEGKKTSEMAQKLVKKKKANSKGEELNQDEGEEENQE